MSESLPVDVELLLHTNQKKAQTILSSPQQGLDEPPTAHYRTNTRVITGALFFTAASSRHQTGSPDVGILMVTAAKLQSSTCSVLYLSSVETESLTGPQAVAKAATSTLSTTPRASACIVHFKVSAQGITLTDNQRKLFFRRHYPVSSVTFCSTDPQDRRWANPDGTTSKIFGFVAKKQGSPCENICHLFAELDPEQPASAIVNFITKVMLGTHRR
ncbi:Tensin-2 [Varanus komodoensis]|nr:Tensin-2 [Varanus komodoensis]